jgi:Spy/CpxP family protein refolding chaperone
MKGIICAVIAAGLLAASPFAGRARAEEEGKSGGKRAEHMEKMMKERLGLSDDQAAKLKAAWEAEKTASKALREQAKEANRKLEEEVRGLASDKEIQATLDQLDAGRKAMAAEHQKLESSVASILKPYQRAKLRLLMAHMMKGRGRWGHGGRGGEERGRKGGEEHEHHDDD